MVEYDEDRLRVGGETSGYDVLGRHAYALTAVWSAASARPDVWAAYAYDRWRPTFFVSGSDEELQFRDEFVRERKGDIGVFLPVSRVRRSQGIFASFRLERGAIICPEDQSIVGCEAGRLTTAARNGIRFGWQFSNAKQYGYSVSREHGITTMTTAEIVRPALGADGGAESVTGDVRGYLPFGPRRAVLAARVAAGTSRGDAHVRRFFTIGGPGPKESSFSFGSDSLALLRGFSSGDAVGRHTVALNLDYRFPLLRIERGWRTWPLLIRWVHGAVFFDAGDAFGGNFQVRNLKTSTGVELSLDTAVLYGAPLTFTVGIARRHDPTRAVADGASFFVRVGRAF